MKIFGTLAFATALAAASNAGASAAQHTLLNPQPEPPGRRQVMINPQPLPPHAPPPERPMINPQPLPPAPMRFSVHADESPLLNPQPLPPICAFVALFERLGVHADSCARFH